MPEDLTDDKSGNGLVPSGNFLKLNLQNKVSSMGVKLLLGECQGTSVIRSQHWLQQ